MTKRYYTNPKNDFSYHANVTPVDIAYIEVDLEEEEITYNGVNGRPYIKRGLSFDKHLKYIESQVKEKNWLELTMNLRDEVINFYYEEEIKNKK